MEQKKASMGVGRTIDMANVAEAVRNILMSSPNDLYADCERLLMLSQRVSEPPHPLKYEGHVVQASCYVQMFGSETASQDFQSLFVPRVCFVQQIHPAKHKSEMRNCAAGCL
eukprot:2248880-Rhodomonas_salina.1